MSEYDIISNFRTEFSSIVLSKMRFFCNFLISQLKFGTGIQNWMVILISGSISSFGDDFGQYDTKTIILHLFLAVFFCQVPLRNSVVVATPKVPGNQKLFERACYLLKLKVTKFQLPKPNGFWAVLKNQLGGGGANLPPLVQNIVKVPMHEIFDNFLLANMKDHWQPK